jgi:predicted MPP superfamily phosphohydrolase
MAVKIILFLGVVLILISGAHLFFYKAIVRFLIITNPPLKSFLFIFLLLLSLSFLSSFFLLNWKENPFTVRFYMFSAIWTGLFINLLLALPASWLIIVISRFAGINPNTRIITTGCLCLAVLLSAYGCWNAYHPRITRVIAEFKNLPDQWKDKTIVQLSDVHLGHFHTPEFLNNLTRRVNSLKPDLILITGDLFDGMAATQSNFTAGLKKLHAEKGIFFVTGNHEIYVGLNRALNVLWKTKIRLLHNEMAEINGLQIIGISYPGIGSAKEIRGLAKFHQDTSNDKSRILLFHTPTNISPQSSDSFHRHFATYWVPDTTFSLAKQLKVDLQLSGHTHAGQIFPFGYLTKLIYKGYDYGLHHLDGFAIYTTSGVGTWGPPMRTGNTPEIVEIKLSG